jgi:hypothetical protein
VVRITGRPLADAANLFTIGGQFLAIVISIVSVIVALAAFRDAQASGIAQQKALSDQYGALGEVHGALVSVVGQLQGERELIEKQRELMDKTYEASSRHLELVQRSYEEERARLARRPVVHIGLAGIAEEGLGQLIGVRVGEDGWGPLNILLRNDGDADLPPGAVVMVIMDNTSVGIDNRRFRVNLTPQRLQVSLDGALRRFSLTNIPTSVEVDLHIPDTVTAPFSMTVHVLGENTAVTRSFQLTAVRQPAGKKE